MAKCLQSTAWYLLLKVCGGTWGGTNVQRVVHAIQEGILKQNCTKKNAKGKAETSWVDGYILGISISLYSLYIIYYKFAC